MRPYSSHKIDPKSNMCIFLGYSLRVPSSILTPLSKKYLCHVISSLWSMFSHSLNGTRSLGIQLLANTQHTLHVSLMRTRLVTQMIVPPQVLFSYSLVLIQSPGVLQSNVLLLDLPLRSSIMPLSLLLPNRNG